MKKITLYLIMLVFGMVTAQKKDKDLPKGNEAFVKKDYASAEADYRVSDFKSPTKSASAYNLGNAIYRQKQIAEAKHYYLKSIKSAKSRDQKHEAYHNLGNVYMGEKDYTQAVETYKSALRNNPLDEETRYNYALAKQYLKNNPPPKDKKDDKKDKEKKDKDKKDQDKKDQEKKNQDKKDGDKDKGKDDKDKNGDQPKDQGQPKPKEGGISKQRLESMLEAVNNEEKKTQEKVNAKKVKGKPVPTEKDW